jgi:glycosyltransferase involved in cell wall biosynthesis
MIAKSIAEGLVARGHQVTVLAARHQPSLARKEILNGVQILRLDPLLRISRGLLMPAFPVAAQRLIGNSDVVQIHTPLPESLLVASLCGRAGKPLLLTHQGDLVLPAGLANRAIQEAVTWMMKGAARRAAAVTTHNADYALNSSFLAPFTTKVTAIHPPVTLPAPQVDEAAAWRRGLGLERKRVVGFAGRFVEEKGFDVLLAAVPHLAAAVPDVHLVYAGEPMVYERFAERCRPLLRASRARLTTLGLIRDRQRLANFYALCDAFALPSRSECFGTTQVEAMLAGTPVVATDIPGGRDAVRTTGMGLLVEPESPRALAAALAEVLADPARHRRPEAVGATFDESRSLDEYESLLAWLAGRRAA